MTRSAEFICAGYLLLLVVCGVVMVRRQPAVSFPAPSPNGYCDFLQAAALLPDEVPFVYSDRAALEAFVSKSAEAYALVQAGLERTCCVPLQASKQWLAQHGQEMARLKRLTWGLIAKAKLAELEGRTEAAFEDYTTAYRFAKAIGRGGLAVDFLSSISCKALVMGNCQSLIPSLTPKQEAQLLELIQTLEAEQEKPTAVATRTYQWQRVTLGFHGRLQKWRTILSEAWRTRSWAPLETQGSILARKQSLYEQSYTRPLCQRLSSTIDRMESRTEPDGSANGRQPVRSETNRTSSAAASRR